jgi:hypothetical protein
MTRTQAIRAYRAAADYARHQMTTTAQSIEPPSTAGTLSLLALVMACAGGIVSQSGYVLAYGLVCAGVSFVAGLVLADEASQHRGSR